MATLAIFGAAICYVIWPNMLGAIIASFWGANCAVLLTKWDLVSIKKEYEGYE